MAYTYQYWCSTDSHQHLFRFVQPEGKVFKHIPNQAFRYVVYAYIGVSGMIILLTNC